MSDISEAVGLTKATLYHHFRSIEKIMEAVLCRIQRSLRLEILCIAYHEHLTPVQQLNEFVKKQKEVYLVNRKSCFIGNMTLEIAPINPDLAKVLKEIFNEWVESLADIYTHRHSKKKAKELAMQTVTEFQGAVMTEQLTTGDDIVFDNAIKRAIKRF